MNFVLPVVAMVFFSVLYVGAYAWMRRPKFGESEKPTMRIDSRSVRALSSPKDDRRGAEPALRNVRDASQSTHDQVEMLKRGRS
jgi:hypothetical protein